MRSNSMMRWFIPFLFSAICLIQQPVHAAEGREPKSVLFIDRILLTGSAKQMPADRASALMSVIRKRFEMPQFDVNALPESLQSQFWEKSSGYSFQTAGRLSSLAASMRQVELDIVDAANRGEADRCELLQLRMSTLVTQRRAMEHMLFDQVEKLIAETIGEIFKSSGGEESGEKKAEALGITGEALKRIEAPAYLCLVVMTDYNRDVFESSDTTADDSVNILNYSISGVIIWFRFSGLSAIEPEIRRLKVTRAEATVSGKLDEPTSWSQVDPSEYSQFAFGRAIEAFADKLEPEIRGVAGLGSKTSVIEVNGSKIGIALGKKDGLYINQKFSVYESQYQGGAQKRGFFYITRIGDNTSNGNQLSYGKLVIRGAQPGMQIREYRSMGIDISIRAMYGTLKVDPGQVQFSLLADIPDYSLKIDEEISIPVYVIDACLHYDIGRHIRVPQLFISVGADVSPENVPSGEFDDVILDLPLSVLPDWYVGTTTTDDTTVETYYDKPQGGYWNIYAGFLKKWYIGRIAFYIEPLLQYQRFTIKTEEFIRRDNLSDLIWSTAKFRNSAYSFSPNMGLEFAVRENLDVGLALKFGLPISARNKWSGTHIIDWNSESSDSKSDKSTTSSEVAYPKAFIGIYLTYNFSGY